MATIEINLNPSRRELRIFAGVIIPGFFGLLGGVVYLATGSLVPSIVIWVPAASIGLLALRFPTFCRLIYIAWMRAVQPIGWAVSHLILSTIFYLVMTPIGLMARAIRGDKMTREFDESAPSYWEDYRPGESPDSYFRQF